EHINTVFEQVQGDSSMIYCGNRETDGVDFAENVAIVGMGGRPIQLRNLFRPRLENVDDTGHLNALKLRVQPGVLFSQMSDPDDCNFGHDCAYAGLERP